MTAPYSAREQNDVSTHFQFGQNWREYAQKINPTRIAHAKKRLADLVPGLQGKSFLDIGCGSGLHSLAALELGAARITAIDFDPVCVETTKSTLASHPAAKISQGNILEDIPALTGQTFDIVYSWGVLHHTGNMWKAIENATQYVAPGGLFVIALYAKTRMDWFWVQEKKAYSRLPRWARWPITWAYMGLFMTRIALKGVNPISFLSQYQRDRGMDWKSDVVDWLGGYPYETADEDETVRFMTDRGFSAVRTIVPDAGKWGLFASGCIEFVFRKQ